MNLLLFTPTDCIARNRLQLRDRRLQHLLQVHRAKVGDSVRIGAVNGQTGCGQIVAIDRQQATLSFELDKTPPPKLPITLVLALPRPKMLRRILRSVAEFGVQELHLINSYRVEKSYWQTPVLEADSIRDYLLQGLEQARDTILPKVYLHPRFKPFVEDTLPTMINGRRALLAHPGNHPPCPPKSDCESLLVIGPEGGFVPYEVQKLQQVGCEPISLGARILRVENAVLSLLGKLS